MTGFTITMFVTFISIGTGGGKVPCAAWAWAGCDDDESDGGTLAQPAPRNAVVKKVIKVFMYLSVALLNEWNSPVANSDTERAGELNQGRTRALARINLAAGGRGETAERRAKTHFGREDPIAYFRLAGIRDGRLHHHRIECERSHCVEKMEVRLHERCRTAADQRGFQRGASGARST